MSKYNNVFKNIGILTIGQFSTKILIFLLVPLYTSVLTLEEYGSYDLILTTINLLIPILTLNISASSQRFLLSKDVDTDLVVKISFKYTFLGIFFVILLIWINGFIGLFSIIKSNQLYFIFMFSVLAINTLLTEIAIGYEQIKCMAISGVISTLSTIVLNIFFLLILKLGLKGYFLASIIGPFFQTVYLIYKLSILKILRSSIKQYKKIEYDMLKFSCPQIANTVSWWINNASDRYIVIWFCGIAVNGIYSVAYKIPAIMNIVGGIFSQATGITIIKNFDSEDKDGFFSNTYMFYNAFLIIMCSIIIFFTKPIAILLFAKDFYIAWQYTPLLLMASVFGAIAGYLGSAFSAKFAAREFAISTVIGACVNVLLNIVLVPLMGAIGAAFATFFSYVSIWALRLKHSKRFVNFEINLKRDIVSYIVLLFQSIILCYYRKDGIILFIIEGLFVMMQIIFYKNDILKIICKLRKQHS